VRSYGRVNLGTLTEVHDADRRASVGERPPVLIGQNAYKNLRILVFQMILSTWILIDKTDSRFLTEV
jgi:hypothetical protein